jgi:hypothetical protein
MANPLEVIFPGLAQSVYRITSPTDPDYNCIAWVAGHTDRWWWPGHDIEHEYWPPGIVREVSMAGFEAAFAALGYRVCDDQELEAGFEKIAVFADASASRLTRRGNCPAAAGQVSSACGKTWSTRFRL